jgi:hypothetical protein
VKKFHLQLTLPVHLILPLFRFQYKKSFIHKTERFSSRRTLVHNSCGREQHSAVCRVTSSQSGDSILCETLLGDCLVGVESEHFHFHFKHIHTTKTNKSFQRDCFKQTTIRGECIYFNVAVVLLHRPETLDRLSQYRLL